MSAAAQPENSLLQGLFTSVVGGVVSSMIVRSLTTVRIDPERPIYIGQADPNNARSQQTQSEAVKSSSDRV